MREFINIVEKYSNNNVWLRDYMRDSKFDPYSNWYFVCHWLLRHEGDVVARLTGEHYADAHEMSDANEPDLFSEFPEDVQKRCEESVVEYLLRHDPAEAPTHAHMSLDDKQLLHRLTWLVHFSDHAQEIAASGFRYGVGDIDKLGLTTHLGDFYKSGVGYNFAFEALGRHAGFAAANGKYGRHAVLFQNSGVKCWHYGDEEPQVIFHGTDVPPSAMVLLVNNGGEWQVKPRRDIPHRDFLFSGTYEAAVRWVIKNYAQYRRYL